MTDLEFKRLMQLQKIFVKSSIILPNNGENSIYDLKSKETQDKFYLDVDRRGRIELSRFKLQTRYAVTKLPLVRIDIDSPPHLNPDGTKTSRNHIHIYREVDNDTGIYRGLSLEQIRKCVENNRDAQAVIITSPTYEGVVSEVREIASYLHEKGIPLIVDEAHGAHFEFSEEFPESAVKAGADIVINSIHKTLPALTQTALLHISGNYVDYDKVERFWNIYQTTSPSYILMASIDRCMRIIEGQGDYIFKEYINRLKNLRENIAKLNNIRLMDSDDISKIILICDDGKYLYDRLLDEYKVQLEMASFKYVIAMTSVADKQEYYDRFLSALKEIDKSWKVESKDSENAVGESLGYAINNKPEVCMCPADAIDLMDENGYEDLSVNSPDICGRISMSSVLIYPPGMPVVNVGERITGDVCRIIKSAINAGLEVPGLKEGKIRCLR